MEKYWDIILNSYVGYFNYLKSELIHFHPQNYIYWLLLVSAFFFALELIKPWRAEQAKFRKDFWLDFFYMFFNFFLFSLVIYNAVSSVFVELFNDFLSIFGIKNLVAIQIGAFPYWGQLAILFVIGDFLSWNVHRLLHRVPFLWEFHKLHHSVEEMGFAAHLRYHWMENVVYSSLKYIPLAMIGFSITDLFVMHIFNLTVGHYNHSNISVDGRVTGGVLGGLVGFAIISSYPALSAVEQLGIVLGSAIAVSLLLGNYMKILFNSPEMHIWHHAYEMPDDKPYGVNFGLTLAIWDYIAKTAHMPHSGRDIKLGFSDIDHYPKTFWKQITYGFKKK
jgi:sterol desaturase/sphingolipid hydroxylase (fatty acid hydroxylase superfamily)